MIMYEATKKNQTYLVFRKNSYIKNGFEFWADSFSGYTEDINEAGIYSSEDINKMIIESGLKVFDSVEKALSSHCYYFAISLINVIKRGIKND